MCVILTCCVLVLPVAVAVQESGVLGMKRGSKAKMCRFHVMGTCKNGASCPFSHDNTRTDSFICPYFAKGHCAYGDKCMYDHRVPTNGAPRRAGPSARAAPPPTGPAVQSRSGPPESTRDTAHQRGSGQQREAAAPLGALMPGAETATAPLAVSADAEQPESAAAGKDASLPICAYYAQGLCNFGDACRFRHEAPADTPDAAAAGLEAVSLRGDNGATSGDTAGRLVSLGRVAHGSDVVSGGSPAGRSPTAPKGADGAQGSSAEAAWQPAAGGGRSNQALRIAPPPERPAWRESAPNAPKAQRKEGLTIFDANVDLLDPWEQQRAGAPRPAADSAPGVTQEAWCEQWTMCGECDRGEECPLVHGDQCVTCQYFVLHPHDAAAREAHEEACADAFVRSQRKLESAEMECSICMEVVLSEPRRKFGLLECDHCFCLPCIRGWRSTHISATDDDATRVCPLCRTLTHFVTPCAFWPQTEEEKRQAVGDYKRHLAAVPCRNFDQGRGECPFGSSCFYLHAYPDGTLEDHKLADARMATNSAGEYKPVQELTLSSFLDTARTQSLMRRGRRR